MSEYNFNQKWLSYRQITTRAELLTNNYVLNYSLDFKCKNLEYATNSWMTKVCWLKCSFCASIKPGPYNIHSALKHGVINQTPQPCVHKMMARPSFHFIVNKLFAKQTYRHKTLSAITPRLYYMVSTYCEHPYDITSMLLRTTYCAHLPLSSVFSTIAGMVACRIIWLRRWTLSLCSRCNYIEREYRDFFVSKNLKILLGHVSHFRLIIV